MGEDLASIKPKIPKGENKVKNVLAIMSGKGGVGKSSVTSLLAVAFARKGFKVGILDGDITGPSIPKMFGLKPGQFGSDGEKIIPPETGLGIKIMSINLLLKSEEEAVIWRGPLLSGAIKQFWEDVLWGELDYLLVDLPPGTGDVPLTVLQTLPLKGVVIVSSPQDLAVMVVKKAMKLAKNLDVPILGLIENMAYLKCPHCGELLYPFKKPQGEEICRETGIRLLGTLPIVPEYAEYADRGLIEKLESPEFLEIVNKL
ncbi:Mrp/NBP35 family ATP-binding protein [Carboxydothermus pertinax]|uniref:Iron-sulfur cluster carrier protein n=1 Tax=Carboxydothermus pertinax TaxID=870242 RepID=A0A1L8CRH2_9THEO|nr:Mrp/NBP35 family ATP-binding protein [Carboxydothermus pertinax]GAV21510.1 ATP-binding protein [Carboxydothermus pertinax]